MHAMLLRETYLLSKHPPTTVAPLLWPKDLQLKLRVVLCFIAIAGARAANLLVPQVP